MELLSKFSSQDRHYTESIKTSSYLQSCTTTSANTSANTSNTDSNTNSNTTKKKYKSYRTICELFIDIFDPTCSILEEKEKKVYTDQLLIEIATQIDEDKKDKYDKFNYSKIMKPQYIQQGLQSKNNVSSLLYLSDYYKVSSVIYLGSSKLTITTSDKDRNQLHILYTNGTFIVVDDIPDYTAGVFKDLGEGFVMDIETKDIYNKYLDPISKYKATDLVDLAKEVGISLESNGKKKVKKVLYDEINLYHLNH